jgi:hypothetical protein
MKEIILQLVKILNITSLPVLGIHLRYDKQELPQNG